MSDNEYNRSELEQKVLESADKEEYLNAMNAAAEARKKILSKGISTAELEDALGVQEELRVKIYARRAAAKAAAKKTLKKPAKKTSAKAAEPLAEETCSE